MILSRLYDTHRISGFTLIELMIVVSIIAILASIAIPKFANMVRQSKEGATKGNLGSLRSTLSIYYSDTEGQFPSTMDSLTANGKYLSSIPYAKVANYHADTTQTVYGSLTGGVINVTPGSADLGGWVYDNAVGPTGPMFGTILVNCTHTDTKGSFWTSY